MKTNKRTCNHIGLLSFIILCHLVLVAPLLHGNTKNSIETAKRLYHEGNYFSAEIMFRDIIKAAPKHKIASFYLGKLLRNGDDAAAYLEAVASERSESPEKDEAKYLLGQYWLIKGLRDAAAPYFEQVINEEPITAFDLLALDKYARILMSSGRAEPALKRYTSAKKGVQSDSSNCLLLAGIGDCHFQNGNYENAYTFFDEALQAKCDDMVDYLTYRMVGLHLASGDSFKADTYYSRLKKDNARSLYVEATDNYDPSKITSNEPPDNVEQINSLDRPFWAQVGAFSSLSNAERLIAKIKKSIQVPDSLTIRIHEVGRLKMVRIGAFISEKNAVRWGKAVLKPKRMKFRAVRKK